MMRLLRVFMTLVAMNPTTWEATFEPNPDNVALVLVTECKGTDFYAFDWFPIVDPNDSYLQVRRQVTPKGARCTVLGTVLREVDGENDYVAESVIVIQEDR